jgi:phosphomannomutase
VLAAKENQPHLYEDIRQAFDEALDQGDSTVIVARDGRTHSAQLSEHLIKGITRSGCQVIDIGVVPTPVLYFATYHLDETSSGVMVTASHNPAEYNGFKMVINGVTLADEAVLDIRGRIQRQHYHSGQGGVEHRDLVPAYIDRIFSDVALTGRVSLVVDAGNGVAGEIGPRVLEAIGAEVIQLFCEIDGTFPNHHPDPSEPHNLEDLIGTVQRFDADLGIAFDGDGDRIGAVDGQGRVVWGDQLLAILAEPVLRDCPGATIIADVKASQALYDRIAELGGAPLMWKTGHSLIKSKMKETGAPLAGEMSGHIFFAHEYYGFDDALYAAVRLIRAVTRLGKSLTELRSEMPDMVNTPEMRFQVDEERKFAIVGEVLDRLADAGADVNRTDGARVNTDDGWWLLRASNTQDVLVARAEAKDEAGLRRLVAQIDEQLALSGVERGPQAGH